MWSGNLVIDAVAHGYNFRRENLTESEWLSWQSYEHYIEVEMYKGFHLGMSSDLPGYKLSLEEYTYGFEAEDLAQLYFEETDVDILVYHEVLVSGVFKEGASPWRVGLELKNAHPDRVRLFSFVDPLGGQEQLEAMEERAALGIVDGFKFYPTDGSFDPATRMPRTVLYDDRELVFPFFQKALDLGIKHVGIHKAIPVAPGPLKKERPDDVSVAALAFPELKIEVVHSGWAFLDECVLQLNLHDNIYANLEAIVCLALHRPRRFAEILGRMLDAGAEDRLLFATGGALNHPQPVIEAFGNFEMPRDLIDGYGYPELTPEIKRKIFGLNGAAINGIDVPQTLEKAREWATIRDEAKASGKVGPWRGHRDRIAAEKQLVG
jgi:uncharacterized protein